MRKDYKNAWIKFTEFILDRNLYLVKEDMLSEVVVEEYTRILDKILQLEKEYIGDD